MDATRSRRTDVVIAVLYIRVAERIMIHVLLFVCGPTITESRRDTHRQHAHTDRARRVAHKKRDDDRLKSFSTCSLIHDAPAAYI